MTAPTFLLLAQASSMSVVRMIVALGVVIALAGVLLGLLAIVRRRMHEESHFVAKDFTLNDLRSLHRDGKLTDEEFERAKARLVSGVQSKLAEEAKPSRVEQPYQEELKDA